MTFVKSALKKSFLPIENLPKSYKIGFLGKTLDALFTKVIYTFLKSVRKDGVFDTPFDLFKEKKFSSHRRVIVYGTFYELKSLKWKQPLNISENGFL
jgi:hypothetical protein